MKKVIFFIAIAILLLAINNLAFSIWGIWQRRDVVSEAQKELEAQKQENQRLKSALSYSQTDEFIEKEARDKLFMTKEGEQRVLLPEASKSSQKLSEEDKSPNWKKWWNLFFQ